MRWKLWKHEQNNLSEGRIQCSCVFATIAEKKIQLTGMQNSSFTSNKLTNGMARLAYKFRDELQNDIQTLDNGLSQIPGWIKIYTHKYFSFENWLLLKVILWGCLLLLLFFSRVGLNLKYSFRFWFDFPLFIQLIFY